MKNILFISILIFLVGCSELGKKNEAFYQRAWCSREGGKIEVTIANGTRCDCVTSDYAIEVDFAAKWQQAVGQALNYADVLQKTPGVVLICRNKKDRKKYMMLMNLTSNLKEKYGLSIRVWHIGC